MGYFPSYRGAAKDSIDYSALTHINYFNLDATAAGDLVTTSINEADLGHIVNQAHAQGAGVSVAVGGWLSDSYFAPMSRDPGARANFIDQVTQFALSRNLDGVDLDWEPIDVAAGDDFYYSTLIEELDAALDPHGLILTAAVNPQRYDIQPFAVDNLDWLNVMGYDMNWQNAEHALYEDAVAAMQFWDDIVPPEKLNLGIPFYGRDANWNAIMYSTIVDTYAPSPDQNYAGPYWFNGPDLVASKTQFVYDNGYGGTMVWEVGQDRFDSSSLLGVIKSTTESYVAPAHPYPQHVSYSAGTILPNHRTQAQLDQDVASFYDSWKNSYVVDAGADSSGEQMYRVTFGSSDPSQTVSEGMGFGMIITALMAGHDPDARNVFDGLWRFTREHPSVIDPRLMDWKVPQTGGDDSAFDGDADIAYGLLLADAQWGSSGSVNYAQAANTVIAGILESTIGPTTYLPMLGDWVNPDGSPYNQSTPRSSDLMPAHFRAYGNHTGDPIWSQVVSSTQAVIDAIQTNYSPGTGLLPDFIINADTNPQPAYSGFLEGPNDGNYYYNAGRDPFRIGLDALLNGDAVSMAQIRRIADWIATSTGGNALNIKGGYQLDGTPIGNWFTTFFAAPFGVAAMTDASHQDFLNNIYDAVYNRFENYYEDSVNLLSLLVMSGNFWDPLTFSAGNNPPVAVDDAGTTSEDTPVSLNVLANDTDPDGDSLAIQSVTQGTNGTVTINANNTLTYVPSADFSGSDAFAYTVSDGRGGTATATVDMTISSVMDISISAIDASLPEGDSGNTSFRFSISLDEPAIEPVSVDWAVSGSGINPAEPSDFGGAFPSGTAIVPAGQTSTEIPVGVTGDTEIESDESFNVTLSNASAGTISQASATATIEADDSPAFVNDFADSDTNIYGTFTGNYLDTYESDDVYEVVTEERYAGNKRSRLEHQWTFNVNGGVAVTFHVEAHHSASAEDVRFEYSPDSYNWTPLFTVTKGSDDNLLQSWTMPSSLSGSVWVRVVDTNRSRGESTADSIYIDQMFFRSETGSGPSLPELTLAVTDANAAEAGLDPGEFTLTRTGDTAEALAVYYTVSGTAISGNDYELLSGTVTIPAGSSSVPVAVLPFDDSLDEGNETITLTLASDSAYNVGAIASGTVTLVDDDGPASSIDRSGSSSSVYGSVNGSHENTHSSDNVYQSIMESGYAGNKRSRLEHRWTFNVSGGSRVRFFVEAFHNSAVEDFLFEYSLDGSSWTTMLTVAKLADDDAAQLFELPSGISGSIQVRVIDSSRARGDRERDSVFIDDMYFLSDL